MAPSGWKERALLVSKVVGAGGSGLSVPCRSSGPSMCAVGKAENLLVWGLECEKTGIWDFRIPQERAACPHLP